MGAATLEAAATLPAGATLQDSTAALPVTDWRTPDEVTLRGIMVAVGPIMGTISTNHLITGSIIMMAMLTPTMAMTTPSMCNPGQTILRPRSPLCPRCQYKES